MSKRGPTSELNHDNWDQEEAEAETAGNFKQADSDEIKKRVILQAKRKSASSSGADAAKTPFGNFKGFSSTPTNKPDFNIIGASADSKTPSASNSNGTPKTPDKSSSEYFHQLKSLNVSVSAWISKHVQSNPYCILTPVFKDYEKHLASIESKRPTPAPEASFMSASSEELKQTPEPEKEEPSVKEDAPSSETSTVNKEVSEMVAAAESKPETAMNSIETVKEKPALENSEKESLPSEPPAVSSASNIFGSIGSASTFSFGSTKPATTATTSSTSFVFGNTTSSATSLFGNTAPAAPFGNTGNTNSTFSFGGFAKPGAAPTSSLFGNTASTGFGFGSFAPKPAENTNTGNEDAEENDEPPKVEFKAVAEENSVYEIKCKMFVMKDKEYVERGLGQLYIKKQDPDSKAQLLVRSAGATGQILLNVLLTPTLEPKRVGKNNVQMACIAMPGDANPTIVMIRVKTGEDADEMHGKIVEYKK